MKETCQVTFPVKVQEMRSKNQKPRYYIYIPVALSSALGISPGEEMSWELLDRNELHFIRLKPKPTTTTQRVEGKNTAL
jgi:predicted phosphoadenosine phosphosulfate sulfurtransferase